MAKLVGSRFMITQQLKKVFREGIPRIQTFAEAQQMEAELRRARSGKIFDDKTYLELHNGILQVCRLQGWDAADL